MGLHSFLIALDNESGRFVSHKDTSLVTGKVIIVMGKGKQVEGLKLYFKGKAKAVWSESHGKHTITYVGREHFFSQTFSLMGGPSDGMREKVLLPSGEHSFPFCLSLPPELPSSCKELYGSVKYTVEAVVERSWKTNFNTKRKLQVVAPLDLSSSPDCMMPGRYSNEKHFCCLWCRSGPLTLVLSVPSRGVVLGRDFPVTVEADNASSEDVSQLVAKVKKYTTFRASSPWAKCRLLKKTICSLSFGPVAAKGSAAKTAVLPALTEQPVNVDRCQVLDIDYYLEVTASVSGCHGNLRVSKQVKFGSSPPGGSAFAFTNAGFVADPDDFRQPPPPPPYSPPIVQQPYPATTQPFTSQMQMPFPSQMPQPYPPQMPQPYPQQMPVFPPPTHTFSQVTDPSAPPLEPKVPLDG